MSSHVRGAIVLSELSGSNFLVPDLWFGLLMSESSRSCVLYLALMVPFSGMDDFVIRNAGMAFWLKLGFETL